MVHLVGTQASQKNAKIKLFKYFFSVLEIHLETPHEFLRSSTPRVGLRLESCGGITPRTGAEQGVLKNCGASSAGRH